MEQVKQLAATQADRLFFYNPYNFLRSLEESRLAELNALNLDNWWTGEEHFLVFTTSINNHTYHFLYQALPWESNYFSKPFFKLFTLLSANNDFEATCQAIQEFISYLKSVGAFQCFINIPAEDIFLIQALTASGYRLTETRLTYFHDNLENFTFPRFPVRPALEADIPLLKEVAANCRNNLDRYHADVFFSRAEADSYLATYAEACINGLTETVLVPNEEGLEPSAFLAISRLKKDAATLNTSLAQITLTAVSPSCKGWHLKLCAETLQYAKELHCRYVLMTTQATNRAVFRTTEKLGFKLGNTTHILAINF